MLRGIYDELRQTPWKATGPFLAIIVIGVMTALLVPIQDDVEQRAQTAAYHETAPNYPLETWAALLAAIFAGGLAVYAALQRADLRQSSERQLRAYVFVDSQIIKNHKDEYECQFIMKNTGQTPAYAVRDTTDAWIDNVTDREDEPEFEPNTLEEVCIGAGDRFTAFQGLTEGTDVCKEANIIGSKKAIWGAIRVSYRDTFGRQWETELLGYFVLDRLYTDDDRKLETVTYRAT